jgi:hypothetical protein
MCALTNYTNRRAKGKKGNGEKQKQLKQRHQLWNIEVGNLRDRLSAMAFQKINDTAAKGNIIK